MKDGTLRRWTLLGLAIGFVVLVCMNFTANRRIDALEFENAGQWKRISQLETFLGEPKNNNLILARDTK
jgi:hypothetical protein